MAGVGDTPLDLQAAANASAGWIVGVLSGAYELDALGRVLHTHLLRSIAQLPPLLASLDWKRPSWLQKRYSSACVVVKVKHTELRARM